MEFEQFRLAVRNSKKKTLDLEVENGEVFIDDVMLAPVNGHFPVLENIPDQDATVTELPTDTLSALSMLALRSFPRFFHDFSTIRVTKHKKSPCFTMYEKW